MTYRQDDPLHAGIFGEIIEAGLWLVAAVIVGFCVWQTFA